jgi:hypothetical protein
LEVEVEERAEPPSRYTEQHSVPGKQQEFLSRQQDFYALDTGPIQDVSSPFNSSMGPNLAAYAVIDDADASAAGKMLLLCNSIRTVMAKQKLFPVDSNKLLFPAS